VALLSFIGDNKIGTVNNEAEARTDIVGVHIVQKHIGFEAMQAEAIAVHFAVNLRPKVFG
jgi:hypothetical protein